MAAWEQHGEGVYSRRYRSLNLNIGLVDCGDGLLVIDTRANHAQARELHADIARLSKLPVAWVVNTHHHWDHTFGNHEFLPAPIWGHERCRTTLLEGGERMRTAVMEWATDHADAFDEVVITPPDHVFRDEATVTFAGRTIALSHLGRGHTDNDVVVVIPDAGVVFAGDLIEEGAPPAFQDSFPLEWPVTVAALADLVTGPVVPGHGRVVDRDFVAAQLEELTEVKRLAEERNLDGMSPADAAAAGGPYPPDVLLPAFQRAWRHGAEGR
jgi:glyoxylase-like metal-dependent hydrolase (beta-lactamase superfamily II)